jgi:hypothetical protein
LCIFFEPIWRARGLSGPIRSSTATAAVSSQ